MNKSLQVASTVIAVLVGIAISRYAKYKSQVTRPVEMESIPAGYSYEGRFGQGRDVYSKLKSRNGNVVEISGYRINRRGEVRSDIPYAIDCKKSLRRWEGEWAKIEVDSLAEAFEKRYC